MTVRPAMPVSGLVERLRADGLLLDDPRSAAEVTGITDDSNRVQAGDLFCAWSGTASDGHTFVHDAAEAGAVAALVERRVRGISIPQIPVRNGRRAAAVASALFHGDPQENLRLVGVTGTNGKTTCVWILRHMLSHGAATGSIGTLGAVMADGSVLPGSETLTTPGPVDVMRLLRALLDRGVHTVVMEVSSHALDQGRVHALRFEAALFTNLTRDHLDYHGTLETYLAAKRSLVKLLGEDGCAVINADDPAWAGLADDAPCKRTFGLRARADVTARDIQIGAGGVSFELCAGTETAQAHLPLLGSFNVANALGAAATGLSLGYTVQQAATALATTPQVPGRLERISLVPCPVLRDYAHTPDALRNVLEALRPLTTGRLIVVFGAGGDRDRGKRPLMGAIAEQLADVVVVTSDNPRTEDPDTIVDEIEAGMSAARQLRITDRRTAIAEALRLAQPTDIVLLAGKGHETYQVIGDEKQPFDERVIVSELTGGAG
jgi:UDP-N-acetylmuramoyl-L-alanyl-D-glutamate--2,6-diaminopimelate ligase